MKSATASAGVKEDVVHEIVSAKEPALAGNYNLILWNDDVSPVGLVIHALIDLLSFSKPKAIEAVSAIEKLGKGIVYSGPLEVCELRHEQFTDLKLTTTIDPP